VRELELTVAEQRATITQLRLLASSKADASEGSGTTSARVNRAAADSSSTYVEHRGVTVAELESRLRDMEAELRLSRQETSAACKQAIALREKVI